jgi:hypothetical protein
MAFTPTILKKKKFKIVQRASPVGLLNFTKNLMKSMQNTAKKLFALFCKPFTSPTSAELINISRNQV